MSVRPGSVAWLMQHELRLYWRSGNRKFGSNRTLVFMLLLLHLLSVPAALVVKNMPPLPGDTSAVLLTFGGGFVLLMMISRGLVMTVQALYARGDIDLLLSSPLPARSIITVRTTAIAVSLVLEFALLIWPFTNVFVLFGMFGALKGYLLLPAVGLLATSVSLVLALLFFYAFGARRTRVIAQVMSALIAIAFTLIVQIPNMMGGSAGRGPNSGVAALARYATAAGADIWLPAHVILNGALPTLALGLLSTLIFCLTTRTLADSFIRASIAAAGVGAPGGHASAGRRARTSPRTSNTLRFDSSTQSILIRKEFRLIVRDPWLLSQILQQSLVILPIAVLTWRHSGNGPPLAWVTLIFISGNIASALTWLAVTAEDAPDLLAASPIARGFFLRAKLTAALLPVVPIALLPLVLSWRSSPWFEFCVSVCAMGAALSCALLNVHERPPAQRKEFRQRLRGNVGRAFLELVAICVWVGIFFLLQRLNPLS